MNRTKITLAAALAVILSLPAVAGPNHPESTMISVGSEAVESAPPRLIIAVKIAGSDVDGLKYFSVALEAGFDDRDETDGVPYLHLDVVPIAGIPAGLHVLRTEIRRDVDLGIDSSISIHAIGWEFQDEGAALAPHAAGFALDLLDVRLAVDLIGFRFFNPASFGQEFAGAQLLQVEAEIGGSMDVHFGGDYGLNIKAVYLGVRGGAAVAGQTWLYDSERFSAIQAAIETAYGSYGVGAEAGIRSLELDAARKETRYVRVTFNGTW